MSRYVSCVVYRDGVPRYLNRGKLTTVSDNATHYYHPSNARQGLKRYKDKHPRDDFHTEVYDTRDWERIVP